MQEIAQEKLFSKTNDWERRGADYCKFVKQWNSKSEVLEVWITAGVMLSGLNGTHVGKEGSSLEADSVV